jgi:hypothetical protein
MKEHQHACSAAKECIQIFQLEFAKRAKIHAARRMKQAYTAWERVPLSAVDPIRISLTESPQSACHATKEVIH